MAIRSWVKRNGRSIAEARSGGRRGQVVTWLASHAAGLQLGGAVVAGILLLIVPVSWLSFLIIGVLLAAWSGIFLADLGLLRWKAGYDENRLYRVDSGAYNWCGLTATCT